MFNRRRPCMMPPVHHPVVQETNYQCHEYIVPEIHPMHTTTVNKHLYKHYHTFPQTHSEVDDVYHQHFVPAPQARPRPRLF